MDVVELDVESIVCGSNCPTDVTNCSGILGMGGGGSGGARAKDRGEAGDDDFDELW
ncbi:MAG: hypothetical protein IJT97_03160 [Bacteroidaceae bacterium]|nr:hypothetical protein [Bacteroidaceae bacterium]